MKNTKEGLPKGGRWWYYAYLVIAGLLFCLWMPLQVSADGGEKEKSHVALVVDAQEADDSQKVREKRADLSSDDGISQKTQPARIDRAATDRMLMHIFVVVSGGVLCVGLGIGVLAYHVRRDKEDAIYIANIRRCYGELSVSEEPQKQNKKENYGRETVSVREKQA